MHEISFYIFPSQNFVDLGLYQYGWEKCEPGHSYGPAKRNHYLFHYLISGRGRLLADDKQGITRDYELQGGQGFLIFPDQINTYAADIHEPWEYTWLEFDGLRVKHALELAGLSQDQPIYHARFASLGEQMRDEMLYIARHSEESPLHLIGHLYLFLDLLTRSALGAKKLGGNKMRDYYIREAIAYIENNFQYDISVEDISESIGLNRSYFGRIFRNAVGYTPQQFLIQYRMVKATELLMLTQLSINEIGAAVGYPDQMRFSRAFKTVYGFSPRAWRNSNRMMKDGEKTAESGC